MIEKTKKTHTSNAKSCFFNIYATSKVKNRKNKLILLKYKEKKEKKTLNTVNFYKDYNSK